MKICHFERTIEKFLSHHLIVSPFVVGVSGGMDSMCLLYCLERLFEKKEIIVAHLDHGVRPYSKAEARFVEGIAISKGFTFFQKKIEEKPQKENFESWARNKRYEFLENLRNKYTKAWIFTAHHCQDQVETFLFKFLSGRLITSSCGPKNIDVKRKLARPLSALSRADIISYAKSTAVPYIIDPSNYSPTQTRNIIRHFLLPQLEREFNPSLQKNLLELKRRRIIEETYLEEEASKKISSEEKILHSIINSSPAISWRILRTWITQKEKDLGMKIGARKYSEIIEALKKGGEKSFDLLEGWKLVLSRGSLHVRFSNLPTWFDKGEISSPGEHVIITHPWKTVLSVAKDPKIALCKTGERGERVIFSSKIQIPKREEFSILHFSPPQVGQKLPNANGQWRSLSRYGKESGLDKELRRALPLVSDSQGIPLWVPGVYKRPTNDIYTHTLGFEIIFIKQD